MTREAFGPNLRRVRLQRGISLETLAATTRVSADLWRGLEENNYSRWPTGIFARAYVRQYAEAIGLDPDATVDEFCRWFAPGDRRAERVVRETAAIVGHRLDWTDDLVGVVLDADRRTAPTPSPDTRLPSFTQSHRGRIVAAVADAAAVVAVGLAAAALLPIGKASALAGCAFLYHAIALATLGCTPAVWGIDTYVRSRYPSENAQGPRFLRLAPSTDQRPSFGTISDARRDSTS
jgi:transcriptional regulator with XRE-family HTH domain